MMRATQTGAVEGTWWEADKGSRGANRPWPRRRSLRRGRGDGDGGGERLHHAQSTDASPDDFTRLVSVAGLLESQSNACSKSSKA